MLGKLKVSETLGSTIYRKTVCLSNFQIILRIWNSNPDSGKEQLLENILKTFHVATK